MSYMTFERDISCPPLPDGDAICDWALFLDLDGTMIDLAPTPDSVIVPADLIETLAALQIRLSGAVAVVSGRALATIDRLLQPLRLAAAGEHGAALRSAAGEVRAQGNETAVPSEWRTRIRRAAAAWPGVLVEEKDHSVAVHYRANPQAAADVARLLDSLAAEDARFEVLPAVMARELRHRSVNKGAAVRALMADQPFSSRRPLFIGDDVTDMDGIAAARALGGEGYLVPDVFGGEPARVRAWLRSLLKEG